MEGNSNILVRTLLKSVMPTVNRFVESGKIDTFLQELKLRYSSQANMAQGESVEILITTEEDGKEYANIVLFGADMQVKEVILQQRLSELLTALFNQADM